jgi:hypothetical protein
MFRLAVKHRAAVIHTGDKPVAVRVLLRVRATRCLPFN